jgi:hypothetical protein
MKLSEFLSALLATGKVEVEVAPLMEVDPAATALLIQYEAQWRLRLPGKPPEFHPPAALWAAEKLYHACRLAVCRQAENTEILNAFKQPCPEPHSASVDYSVDVLFHHLPEVFALAKRLAPDDLLVLELKLIAENWPLSAVGIAGLTPYRIDHILEHPALARLYLDRIFQTKDTARSTDPRVITLVREALGAYPGLSPELAATLNPENQKAA